MLIIKICIRTLNTNCGKGWRQFNAIDVHWILIVEDFWIENLTDESCLIAVGVQEPVLNVHEQII